MNANDSLGGALFQEYDCLGVPHLVYIDNQKNEVDRIIGYMMPTDYLNKIKEIASNKNTFKDVLNRYNKGDHSAENLEKLAHKYEDKGDLENAVILYKELLKSGDISRDSFLKAKYMIAVQSLTKGDESVLLNYLNLYPESPFIKDAFQTLIRHYASTENIDKEIKMQIQLITLFPNDASVLNGYAWRMSEIEKNLGHALEMASLAISLSDDPNTKANILDTKAEVLFKLKRYSEAIEVITEAIEINPESSYFKDQKQKFIEEN